MDDIISNREVIFASVFGLLHACLVRYTYGIVPEPYMDEEFHVNQTRYYCNGDYLKWNSKITTPPALYLLSVPLFCGAERYFNSALLPICFLGLCALRKRMTEGKRNAGLPLLTALNILALPVLFDTSILYYTDLLSLTAVVWGFYFEMNMMAAAACFTIGVLTRQTNIVWAGMFCVIVWLRSVDFRRPIRSTVRVLLRILPFICLGVAFFAFVVINGGIVLGDKSAHKPVFHAAQFLYFLGFISLSTAPIFAEHMFHLGLFWYPFRKPYLTLLLLILFTGAVHFCTLSHPYLLADNRHFPFYLWRKFLNRNLLYRFLPIPLYIWSLFYLLRSTYFKTLSLSILFIVCTCACVVPAHLIEFRYFIIPYSLWRLSVNGLNNTRLLVEFAWSTCISLVALYLFFNRPFVWDHDSTHAVQRFMW